MDIRRRNIGASIKGATGGGSSSSGTYTINLNGQWEKTTAVSNPDSSLYDGVYRSSSNYNVSNGVSIMYITIRDCSTFKMYIRSYAESSCDYVMISQLDKSINGSTSYSNTTLVKAHTRGNQQSGTALTSYTLVEYTGISSGEHTITVVYRKDSSVNSGDDRGYVLIPYNGEGGNSGGGDVDINTTNAIIYTTTDGNAITPRYLNGELGRNLENNIYSNGVGVITFKTTPTKITDELFCSSVTLSTVSLPDSITTLSGSSFNYCTALTHIDMPKKLSRIESSVFSRCSSLTSITIPSSVTYISSYVFGGCKSIKDVYIGSLTSWCNLKLSTSNPLQYGAKLYLNNIEIKELSIPSNVTQLKSTVFYHCPSFTGVTIPDSVTSIGSSAFTSCINIEKLSIGSGVTSIGEHAFSGCTSLTSVTIPDSVTSIGYDAFNGCNNTKSVNIGSGVTSFGNRIFNGCTGNLSVRSNLTSYATFSGSSFTNVTIERGVTEVGNSAFFNCSSIKNIIIADTVTTIGHNTFYNCSGLQSIIIPSSVTSLYDTALDGCTGELNIDCALPTNLSMNSRNFNDFTSLVLGKNAGNVTDYAFYASKLKSAIIKSNGNTSIGRHAFQGCTALTNATIESGVTSIGSYAFYNCSSLTSITIPDTVTSIGERAFLECSSLPTINGAQYADTYLVYATSSSTKIKEGTRFIGTFSYSGLSFSTIDIPSSVISIESHAFANNKSLTGLTLPEGFKSIKDGAFRYCSSLRTINIPSSVVLIEGAAFDINYCKIESVHIKNLSAWCNIDMRDNPLSKSGKLYINNVETCDIVVPQDITTIKHNIFSYYRLNSITIHDNVTSIEDSAFYNTRALKSIYIPDSVTSFGDRVFYNSGIQDIRLPNNFKKIGSSMFEGCQSLSAITIPNSVIEIGEFAFDWCKIETITISDNIETVGGGAFRRCDKLRAIYSKYSSSDNRCLVINGGLLGFAPSGITSYSIPNNVNIIAERVFEQCSSLISVIIPNSVTSIGDYAFNSCSSLTSVTIPDSVTSIGVYAFNNCTALTSVTIGKGVTSIGYYVFSHCSNLKSVYCKATTPPKGDFSMFDSTSADLVIYVPTSSVSAYKSATYWKDYADKIVGYDF